MTVIASCELVIIIHKHIVIVTANDRSSAFLQCIMPQSPIFVVLVAVFLINSLFYCSAENVYCVTPTATSCSSCPHNSTNCTTLSEYAQEAELYFTSNTTVVFLPGDHVLNADITVANVSRLTMHGESSSSNDRATVVCNEPVGLKFTNTVNFKIHYLAFINCSRNSSVPLVSNYALLLQSSRCAELVDCSFHDNLGTALVVINTTVILAGNSEFTHEHCTGSNSCVGGGGITALSSNLTFTGNTTCHQNNAIPVYNYSGGAIYASRNTVLSFNGTTNFVNNSADYGGAIYAFENTRLSFNGTSNFINNSVQIAGGAIYTSNNTVLSFSGTTNFIINSAGFGGAIYTFKNTTLSFNGTSTFINNSVSLGGGAIYASNNTLLTFNGNNNFTSNLAISGGAIYTLQASVLCFNGTNNFIGNSAPLYAGAIYAAYNTTLTFNGTINFTNNGCNTGEKTLYGGGMFMGLRSVFYTLPYTTVQWENNCANFGGSIYVLDTSPLSYCEYSTYIPKQECFFQLPDQTLSNGTDIRLVFKNNSADTAGSVLYGGAIDHCKLTGLDSYNSGYVFNMTVHIEDDDSHSTSSNISSEPFHICPCENHLPDCSKSQYRFLRTVYPGETFQISVVAAGQRGGTVPSTVRSSITKTDHGSLREYQYLQPVNNTCTTLGYTVFTLSQQVHIILYPEASPCPTFVDTYVSGVLQLNISVSINQTCPPGFNISESTGSCVCEPRLAHYIGTHQCNITNGVGEITRDSGQHFWVGYGNQSHELILHPHCPLDFCVNDKVIFPLDNTDIQCAYNRSGLLCGACKQGYSLVLGTSRCWKCTNSHLALLVPFAMMGVALVFLLLVCKLTVATGTLSGLVFYANIVGANRAIFLPVESTGVLSFIAWLNLDFGIETCFFDGMDAYSKTWLQFVFPVYLLVIVGLMILVSRYSHKFAKLLGNNPVSVLATLILLSYTKILRTLINVIYITYLEYPTYNRSVWLYNANIDYLSGKHIPLFLVAVLVFLFLFLPYTLLLLFGQWLQAISHLRLFSWVNRLKPFMDSYHAPYKAKHRYWPGLLLVLRFVLLLVFAFEFDPQQDRTSINLLAILVGTGVLQMWAWVSGGVYRKWCLDALEGSFALNLIILATSTMYTYHLNYSQEVQLAVGYTSVFIALATFTGILAVQLANVTGIAQYLKRKCVAIRRLHHVEVKVESSDIDTLPDRLVNPGEYEPLLDTPEEHMTAEQTEQKEMVNEAQERLTPVYTYGSTN